MSTITKEYVNEQVNVCHEKLEAIMESLESGEDIYHALINFDTAFEIFYDRWVLFFTNYEPKRDGGEPQCGEESGVQGHTTDMCEVQQT